MQAQKTQIGRSVFLGVAACLLAGTAQAETSKADHQVLAIASVPIVGADRKETNSRFDATAQVKQGFAMLRQGRKDRAVQLFDNVIVQSEQALAGDNRKRLCRVVVTEDVVSVDQSVCDAHFGKGFALIDLGKGDQAEAELYTATQMAPDNAHFANEYAELFKSRRDWAASYAGFAKAWAVVDRSLTGADVDVAARALRGMGFNKAQMGDYDEAEALFRQSLQYQPKNEIALAELGNIARRKAIGS